MPRLEVHPDADAAKGGRGRGDRPVRELATHGEGLPLICWSGLCLFVFGFFFIQVCMQYAVERKLNGRRRWLARLREARLGSRDEGEA